jgi:hypothetical protein
VADEFEPRVALETLLNVKVNVSIISTELSSDIGILIVWLPETPPTQVNVPFAAV